MQDKLLFFNVIFNPLSFAYAGAGCCSHHSRIAGCDAVVIMNNAKMEASLLYVNIHKWQYTAWGTSSLAL